MELTPMRFRDYVWPHNPETYSIAYERRIAVQKIPFGRCAMQDIGLTHRVMRGEGTFSGEGAYEEFKKLASVFYQGGAGVLVHPVWQTTRAFFVSLEMQQRPLPDYVRYRFEFWEEETSDSALLVTVKSPAETDTAAAQGTRVHVVTRGDTLWGIARRYGVTLSALLAANPQIKNPNYIVVGERVKLP